MTRSAFLLAALVSLYLGVRWTGPGRFENAFALSFFLMATVFLTAAILTADPIARQRGDRRLLVLATLPLSLRRLLVTTHLLSFLVSAALAVAVLAAFVAVGAVSPPLAGDLAISLAPALVLGWGIGALAGGLAEARVQALLAATGIAGFTLLATRRMTGWLLDLVGLGSLANVNPLDPVHAALIDALTGWGGNLELPALLAGLALAALGLLLAQRKGVPR